MIFVCLLFSLAEMANADVCVTHDVQVHLAVAMNQVLCIASGSHLVSKEALKWPNELSHLGLKTQKLI